MKQNNHKELNCKACGALYFVAKDDNGHLEGAFCEECLAENWSVSVYCVANDGTHLQCFYNRDEAQAFADEYAVMNSCDMVSVEEDEEEPDCDCGGAE